MMLGQVLAGQTEQEHITNVSDPFLVSSLLAWMEMGEALPWAVQRGLSSVLVQRCGTWAASLAWGLRASPE